MSLLFVLVFVFPSIYQSVHVVQHHWQALSVHSCSCHHHKHKSAEEGISQPAKAKESCPILDFEFATFYRTSKVRVGAAAYVYNGLVKNEIHKFVFTDHVRVITLRGPPLSVT